MERMKEIEIFGIPALFTEKRIDHDAVYPGMYRYHLCCEWYLRFQGSYCDRKNQAFT